MNANAANALAERLRSALLAEAIRAFEDARISGLCAEGAWEIAYGAMRDLDLSGVLAPSDQPAQADKATTARGGAR